MVFDLFFYCVTVKTIYRIVSKTEIGSNHQGRVVRKPVKVNPGLNVNCTIIFFLFKNDFDL